MDYETAEDAPTITNGTLRGTYITTIKPNSLITFRSDTVERDGCHVIKPGNASLAAEWENIPETLLLNGVIGVILFLIFILVTYYGWRYADTEDKLKNQNIVTFLYGYRDPEQWYVIPRLEFLRHEERHHQHDLNYPYIYVPPKLPLANPFEVFDPNNGPRSKVDNSDSNTRDQSKSIDSTQEKPVQANDQTRASKKLAKLHGPSSDPERGEMSVVKSKSDSSSAMPANRSTLSAPESNSSDSPIRSAPTLPPQLTESTQKNSSKLDQNSPSASALKGLIAATKAAVKSPMKNKLKDTIIDNINSNNNNNNINHNKSNANQSFFYPSILTAEQLQASALSRKLNRFFAMFFRVTDADIIYARGIDAYEYLLFQRHLILIATIVSVLCLGVILPIHWFAGVQSRDLWFATSFQRSTIKNIATNTQFHWAHIVCSVVIVICALKIMNSYRESIVSPTDQQLSRRTLLIGNIPVAQRNRAHLLRVLREYFPKNTIEAIQFVYDTSQLDDYETYLSSTIVARDYCQAYKRKYHEEIQVHKTDVNSARTCDGYCRCCSFCYVCCFYWPRESRLPGTSYYADEENLYREKITQTCEKIVREPTEYAFVTFKSHRQAKKVMLELANMKHEVLEGKSFHASNSISSNGGSRTSSPKLNSQRSSSSSPPTSSTSPVTGPAPITNQLPTLTPDENKKEKEKSKGKEKKKNEPEQRGKGAKSKYIEVASNESTDILDPKNNPHVRSIRSPAQMKGSRTIVAKGATSPPPVPKGSSERKSDSGGTYRRGQRGHFQPFEVAKQLDGPIMWSVRYAPHPDNVEFKDLLNLSRTSKYTIVFLHLLMVVIFIFITTPNVILSMIERISILRPDKAVQLTGFQGLLINYMSILLQIITTALLPALVTLISKQIPYEDSSSKGHSVMWKVYLFLILMVIIMPSIGMSSALAIFEGRLDAKCLFPTDNGAYYINYIISSIFLSTVLELIKPVDILSYYFILWTSRSTAEIEGARQFIEREFSVGLQHTSVLLIFAVMMTYSISCPLIAPVGLLYLCVKHAVDHYNLYYTYFTKKVDKDLQSTIVLFVKVALILMLFQTTVAIFIHTGTSYFSLISQIIFWITSAAFVFNCLFDCTSRSLPSPQMRARYQHDFCACFYLPRVISSLLRTSAIPASCISRKV